jgi:hypothetical protein
VQFRDLLWCSFVVFKSDDVNHGGHEGAQRFQTLNESAIADFRLLIKSMRVGISRVVQIAIKVHDLDRATASYRDKLGLSLISRR